MAATQTPDAVATSAGDLVLDVVNEVSVDQYRAYQVDIQNMGLGLYGGPAYNQGARNRDGRGHAADEVGQGR